jgi:hypothetical protein
MDIEVTLTVDLKLRHPVNMRELKAHVKQAVECWGGSLHPEDSLFDGVKIAKVKLVKP